MKKCFNSILVIALVATLFGCGNSPKGGEVLVTVGGEKITTGYLDMLGVINPRIKAQMASEFGKKKILDNLVEQELLYQESIKEGLQRNPAVKDKIDIYRKVIISQAYLDSKLEESAKEHYDGNKSTFEKLKLSDILIRFKRDKKDRVKRSEKEALKLANKIKKRIIGGEDFATVAKEVSEDNMSNKRGGDLGLASKDEARLVRRGYGPLLEKAFTIKVKEVEGPIKTEQGYHIITVTEEAKLQPFEEVKQGILFKVRSNARNKVMIDLKKKYPVEYAKDSELEAPKQKIAPVEETKPTPVKKAK